jgi:pyruvate, water dikinase
MNFQPSLAHEAEATANRRNSVAGLPLVAPLKRFSAAETAIVGGKNASLGEMIRHLRALKINVPDGFATTAEAYRRFVAANDLETRIGAHLGAFARGRESLAATGAAIRKLIARGTIPAELEREIRAQYRALAKRAGMKSLDVAVRSSATAEDLPSASFAGQLESYLNVRGEDAVLHAIRLCYASLFTDRAITYREEHGFDHMKVAVSAGVQRMVRSDKACSGVMFSLDPETGFPGVVLINASWGLGEYIVQGIADPDEYAVFKPLLAERRLTPIIEKKLGAKETKLVYGTRKPTQPMKTSAKERTRFVLSDAEILKLARWGAAIERHYGRPMDMEWAKDGLTGELFIVQARPETVQSRRVATALKSYTLKTKERPIVSGLAIGSAVSVGKVCRLKSPREAANFHDGAILVTEMTDPDWGPIMQRASAIVTQHGGRTSHAAIVSREMGLPAVVGAADATRLLKSGAEVTVSCAQGDVGFVYAGRLKFTETDLAIDRVAKTRTEVMINMADPAAALRWWKLPAAGIGLARMEFIIANHIKVHPMALAHFDRVKDASARKAIAALTAGYSDKRDYFVERLAEGIARLAASRYPHPVILRTSDFKTNEYAALVGGAEFEPEEPNPMIGWRGASRYYSEGYRDGFALECRAIRKVREEMGLINLVVMIPFCRTPKEADRVLREMAKHGLKRGKNGLKVYVMCEIPANVVLAEEFARRFDGFSIGSNDLTQLTLGVDRDSHILSALFDDEDAAVKALIADVIERAKKAGAHTGLCGQAPSDHPAFARFLVEAGIDSISVTPDSFLTVKKTVAAAEGARGGKEKA